ncbi:MAG: hypothetical protein Q8O59_03290 [bacterium]|nr:hypothetical protein [bacterium]
MVIENKKKFIDAVAKILVVHPLKIDIEKTTIPYNEIDKVLSLLYKKVLIFKIRPRVDRKKLPPVGVEPTIEQLIRAIKT